MSDFETYRRKADELLRAATASNDMAERSRLISEAAHWHWKATKAQAGAEARPDLDGHEIIPFPNDPA